MILLRKEENVLYMSELIFNENIITMIIIITIIWK